VEIGRGRNAIPWEGADFFSIPAFLNALTAAASAGIRSTGGAGCSRIRYLFTAEPWWMVRGRLRTLSSLDGHIKRIYTWAARHQRWHEWHQRIQSDRDSAPIFIVQPHRAWWSGWPYDALMPVNPKQYFLGCQIFPRDQL